MNLLDILIFAPLLGFFVVLLLPKGSVDTIKRATFVISILVFLASLLLIPGVLGNAGTMSFVTDASWITYPNIRYHVGIDGLSLWLILLTTFLTPIAVLISWIAFAISILLLRQVLAGGTISYQIGGWAAPWGIEYRVDTLNAFVLLIVSTIGAVVLPYARDSVESEIRKDQIPLFYAMFLLCLTGLLGITVTGDDTASVAE